MKGRNRTKKPVAAFWIALTLAVGSADAGVIEARLYAGDKIPNSYHTIQQDAFYDAFVTDGVDVGFDSFGDPPGSDGFLPKTTVAGDPGCYFDRRPTGSTSQVDYVLDTQGEAASYVAFSTNLGSGGLTGFSTDSIHFQEKLGDGSYGSPVDLSGLETASVTYYFVGSASVLEGRITYENLSGGALVPEPGELGLLALSVGVVIRRKRD
jgi:hypothetical protein